MQLSYAGGPAPAPSAAAIEHCRVDGTAAAAFKQRALLDGKGHVVHVAFNMG